MTSTSGISLRMGNSVTPGIVPIAVAIGGTGISRGSGREAAPVVCASAVAVSIARHAMAAAMSDMLARSVVFTAEAPRVAR